MDPVLTLPHQPPVLAARRVLSRDADSGVVEVQIPADWSLLVQGRAPAILGLELIAQGIAAWAAGSGAPGIVLRCRNVRLHRAELPIDVPLRATVRRLDASDGRLGAFAGELHHHDDLLVTGTLLVQRLERP